MIQVKGRVGSWLKGAEGRGGYSLWRWLVAGVVGEDERLSANLDGDALARPEAGPTAQAGAQDRSGIQAEL